MPQNHELSGYQIKRKMAQSPAILRQKLASEPMAEAGGRYNAGCTIDARHPLPFARFVFAAVCASEVSNLAYVHYEQGGFAHLYYVACYDLESTDFEPLWRHVVPEQLEAADDLQLLQELGKLIEKITEGQKSDS